MNSELENLTWRDLAGSPSYQAAFERVISRVSKEFSAAESELTGTQFIEALKQALACGDFVKHCTVGGSSTTDGRFVFTRLQKVTYEPFRECERLKAKVRELESQLDQALRDACPLEE